MSTSRHQVAAHVRRLTAADLGVLVPGGSARLDWFSDGERVREMLARAAMSMREEPSCWQDVWNEMTGATLPGRSGALRLPPGRCRECSGKGWSVRSIGRGSPNGICTACHGNRSDRGQSFVALHARVPVQDRPETEAGHLDRTEVVA